MTVHVSAQRIVESLGGRWRGDHGMCRCPAHEDRMPSLSVSRKQGKVLVHCFGGCEQRDVIAALVSSGLWGEGGSGDGRPADPRDHTTSDDKLKRIRSARDLWDKCAPIKGTLAERYLRARNITWPKLPDDLRYASNLSHRESGESWPCMVAAIRDDAGRITAVQRTYLTRDGSGKAPVEMPKKTLGVMGHGAVRLAMPNGGDTMGLAEGVETALSAIQLYSLPVWATLSAHRLKQIAPPKGVTCLIVFADQGDVGVREAFAAQDHFEGKGLSVEVVTPSAHFGKGASDFNDVVRAGT